MDQCGNSVFFVIQLPVIFCVRCRTIKSKFDRYIRLFRQQRSLGFLYFIQNYLRKLFYMVSLIVWFAWFRVQIVFIRLTVFIVFRCFLNRHTYSLAGISHIVIFRNRLYLLLPFVQYGENLFHCPRHFTNIIIVGKQIQTTRYRTFISVSLLHAYQYLHYTFNNIDSI